MNEDPICGVKVSVGGRSREGACTHLQSPTWCDKSSGVPFHGSGVGHRLARVDLMESEFDVGMYVSQDSSCGRRWELEWQGGLVDREFPFVIGKAAIFPGRSAWLFPRIGSENGVYCILRGLQSYAEEREKNKTDVEIRLVPITAKWRVGPRLSGRSSGHL
jgi:hypothetical protein